MGVGGVSTCDLTCDKCGNVLEEVELADGGPEHTWILDEDTVYDNHSWKYTQDGGWLCKDCNEGVKLDV